MTEKKAVHLRGEELEAHTEQVPAGEVEVHKVVVAEQQTMDVPVTRDEVVIERQAVNRPAAGPIEDHSSEVEIPVYQEEVALDKRTVVREELEIGKRAVPETQQVSTTVQHEEAQIEATGRVHLHDDDADHLPDRAHPPRHH